MIGAICGGDASLTQQSDMAQLMRDDRGQAGRIGGFAPVEVDDGLAILHAEVPDCVFRAGSAGSGLLPGGRAVEQVGVPQVHMDSHLRVCGRHVVGRLATGFLPLPTSGSRTGVTMTLLRTLTCDKRHVVLNVLPRIRLDCKNVENVHLQGL